MTMGIVYVVLLKFRNFESFNPSRGNKCRSIIQIEVFD